MDEGVKVTARRAVTALANELPEGWSYVCCLLPPGTGAVYGSNLTPEDQATFLAVAASRVARGDIGSMEIWDERDKRQEQ